MVTYHFLWNYPKPCKTNKLSTAPVGGNRERKLWTFGKSNFKNQNFWKKSFWKNAFRKNPFLKKENPIWKRLEKMVWASSQKYPLLMASIFFWKIHFETIQFWIQENPIKKKNVFRKEIGQSLIQKISFTHGLKNFWANPFWNNPILNTGKSNQKEKLLFKKINVYSLIHKHPLLMALIQLWKIHFGTILFAKMQNRIWKNNAFEKHTCSQLDPKKL